MCDSHIAGRVMFSLFLEHVNFCFASDDSQSAPPPYAHAKKCPAGWMNFSYACYLLSTVSASWDRGRQDCRDRGADLVVRDSREEQEFISKIIIKQDTWIGLNDRDRENTWKWTDGTPLTLAYWMKGQPDNGGRDLRWGEEDCAHLQAHTKTEENWNDLRCDASKQWICEKVP
uniref:C-type lectin domain-containing protein n=1 Tax=Lates calcarifer TaxID=8187 RepID=A0A4W6G2A6_LATCA